MENGNKKILKFTWIVCGIVNAICKWGRCSWNFVKQVYMSISTYIRTLHFVPSDTSSGFWKLCLTEDSSRRRLKLVANSLGTTHLQASRNKGILAYEYFIFKAIINLAEMFLVFYSYCWQFRFRRSSSAAYQLWVEHRKWRYARSVNRWWGHHWKHRCVICVSRFSSCYF